MSKPGEAGPARRAAEAVVGGLLRRRGLTLAAACLVLGLAYAAIGRAAGNPPKIPVDNGVGIWFLETDPAYKAYLAFQKTFGNDEAILIAARFEDGVFTPDALSTLSDVAARVGALQDVRGVTSLATVLHTGVDAEGAVVVEPMFKAPLPADAAGAARVAAGVRERVLGNPLYKGELVSKDERTTLVTVQLRLGHEELDLRRGEVLEAVRGALDAGMAAHGRPKDSYWWGGMGVTNEQLNELSLVDSMKFFALSTLVLIVSLWIALRRVGAVLLATTTVYLAQTVTLGAYFAAGLKLNLVTMILPTLVMVIGLTDSIYFITTWDQERDGLAKEGLDKRQALIRCLGFCLLPGLFNSVTSAAGFLAFLSADMRVLRHLGLFAGVGILLAFVASVVVCALGLDRFDLRLGGAPAPGGADAPPSALDRLLTRHADFVVRKRGPILVVAGLVAALAAAGLLRLQVDTFTIGYFYEDDPVRRDNDAIEEHFGPYLPLEVVVDAGEPDGVKAPAVLQGIAALQSRIAASEPRVGGSTSVAGVVRRLNEVLGGPGGQVVPDSRELIEQELIFYDPQRQDDPLELVDFPRWQQARVTFRTTNGSSREAEAVLATIQREAQAAIPAPAKATPAGYVPLYVQLIRYLVEGQIWSLATTGLVVMGMLLVLFRSVRYALVSLPSNLLPVLITMGFMGWVGITLDVATVLIASIALGVAVDDTIHFVFKFRDSELALGDTERAMKETVHATGPAIAAASFTMAAGFSVLAFAGIKSVALFGVLMAVTMVSAFVSELYVTPAVVLLFGRRGPAADLPAPAATAPLPEAGAPGPSPA